MATNVDDILIAADKEIDAEDVARDRFTQQVLSDVSEQLHLREIEDRASEAELDSRKQFVDPPESKSLSGAAIYDGAKNSADGDRCDDEVYSGPPNPIMCSSIEIIERSNIKSQTAAMRQMIDKAFFDSLTIDKKIRLVGDDPLHIAIAASNFIGVEILMAELGSSTPSVIAKPDSDGRTALHLAVLTNSARMVELIIGAYRSFEAAQLEAELAVFERECESCLVKLRLGSQGSRSTEENFEINKRNIELWFEQQMIRIIRQFEFRTEVWWTQMMCTKDIEGRSPLHYAASRGVGKDVLEALVTQGRGRFFAREVTQVEDRSRLRRSQEAKGLGASSSRRNYRLATSAIAENISVRNSSEFSQSGKLSTTSSNKASRMKYDAYTGTFMTISAGNQSKRSAILSDTIATRDDHTIESGTGEIFVRSIFNERCMYELSTGHEIAICQSQPTPSWPQTQAIAEPKHKSTTSSQTVTALRTVAWDLAHQGTDIPPHLIDSTGATKGEYRPSVDYDVVIPWVLRNMLKSASDQASRAGSSLKGMDALEELLVAVAMRHSSSCILVVPELRVVLGHLGVRVTVDILREMCRRYPASLEDIHDKWKWVLAQQKEQKRRAAAVALGEDKQERYDDDDKLGAKYGEEKGSKKQRGDELRHFDAKGTMRGDKYQNDEVDDDYYEDGDDSKGGGRTRRSHMSISLASSHKKQQQVDYSTIMCCDDDENLGLDVRSLFKDISTGRGLMSMTLLRTNNWDDNRPYSVTPSASLRQDLEELMQESERDELFSDTRVRFEDTDVDKAVRELQTDSAGLRTRGHQSKSRSRMVGMNIPPRRGATVFLPASVTISTIAKARKNVIDLVDSFGRSPLIIASALGHVDLVSTLLDHGADVSLVTPEGYNVFTVAKNAKVRAIPERRLLSWLNKRQHISAKRHQASAQGKIESFRDSSTFSQLLGSNNSKFGAKDTAAQNDEGGRGRSHRDDSDSHDHNDDGLLRSMNELQSQTNTLQADLRVKIDGGERIDTTTGNNLTLLQSSAMLTDDRARALTSLSMELQCLQKRSWSYGRPPLSWAVHNGLLSSVVDMLRSGSNPNEADTTGRGPLHECCALIKSDNIVHMEAAVDIAEVLIAAGALVNAQSTGGRTPLHEIFCKGQDEHVSYCLISTHDGHVTPYSAARSKLDSKVVTRCRRLLVRALLHLGADPLIKDRRGLAPVHYCARENLADCMLEILQMGDHGGYQAVHLETPLHIACKAGAGAVAHLLCRWDADSPRGRGLLDKIDKHGKTPAQLVSHSLSAKVLDTLWSACRSGNVSRVSEILCTIKISKHALWEEVDVSTAEMHGAAVGLGLTSTFDKTELFQEESERRVRAGLGGDELWLVDGIDSKTRRLRWTPLHACVIGWAESLVHGFAAEEVSYVASDKKSVPVNLSARRVLGVASADTNTQTSSSSFGSSIAKGSPGKKVKRGSAKGPSRAKQANSHRGVIMLLLQSYAFVDSLDINCRTPLMLAVACNLSEACNILLDHGADVNAKDLSGNSPLHFGYAFGAIQTVVALESRGADIDSPNNSGRTPSEEAGRFAHIENFFAIHSA